MAQPDADPQVARQLLKNDVSAADVVLSELLNKRGPAAWVAAEPGGGEAAAQLLELARDCRTCGTLLVLSAKPGFDLVLVPREACGEDGMVFWAFATRLDGVAFISRTIAAKQVAVVLDLDSTLLESEHLPVTPPEWSELEWQTVDLKQQPGGIPVGGRVCRLPCEPHHSEGVHAATWQWQGAAHNYRVRERPGWSHLRELLIRETAPGGKLAAYVLSLGRPLYIQAAWQILDPGHRIIPQHAFDRRINSARPDGVFWVPEKTPCIGTGLRDVFAADLDMRLAPLWCADDLPEVYAEKYRDSVYPVEPYSPVATSPQQYDADGSVLRDMGALLLRFWEHCYGADGEGGALAALAAAARVTLHHLSAVPLTTPAAPAGWCAALFQSQEAAASELSVRAFLELQATKAHMWSAAMGSPGAVEAAVPENDENKASQHKDTAAASRLSAQRVLRPSSRQDTTAGPPGGRQLLSAAKFAAQQSGAAAPLQHFTLQASPAGAGKEPAASTPRCMDCAAGQGPNGGECHGVEDAAPLLAMDEAACLASSNMATGGAANSLQHEQGDLTGLPGRKRDFAAISSQDGLPGPDAPDLAVVS